MSIQELFVLRQMTSLSEPMHELSDSFLQHTLVALYPLNEQIKFSQSNLDFTASCINWAKLNRESALVSVPGLLRYLGLGFLVETFVEAGELDVLFFFLGEGKSVDERLLLLFNRLLVLCHNLLLFKREILFVFFVFSDFRDTVCAGKRVRHFSVEAYVVSLVNWGNLIRSQNRTVMPIPLLLVTTFSILKLRLGDLMSNRNCREHCMYVGKIGGSNRVLCKVLHFSVFTTTYPKVIYQLVDLAWLHVASRHCVVFKRLRVKIYKSGLLFRKPGPLRKRGGCLRRNEATQSGQAI